MVRINRPCCPGWGYGEGGGRQAAELLGCEWGVGKKAMSARILGGSIISTGWPELETPTRHSGVPAEGLLDWPSHVAPFSVLFAHCAPAVWTR